MQVLLRRASGWLVAAGLLGLPGIAPAQEVEFLGWSTLITNDWIGDGQDRWRTGSFTTSLVFGPRWAGELPDRPGALIELRAHGEVVAPEKLRGWPEHDRPYAGVLSFGGHTHLEHRGWEISGGADLVFVGPQTGLDNVQDALHALSDGPDAPAPEKQVSNDIFVTAMVEAGRWYAPGNGVALRPFAEVQAGHETFARLGVDVAIGAAQGSALLARDSTSGMRYPILPSPQAQGWSLTAGGDLAAVKGSVFFPERGAAEARRLRGRMRAGVQYDTRRGAFFAGVAWLGPEFKTQRSGQRVGSLSALFRF